MNTHDKAKLLQLYAEKLPSIKINNQLISEYTRPELEAILAYLADMEKTKVYRPSVYPFLFIIFQLIIIIGIIAWTYPTSL